MINEIFYTLPYFLDEIVGIAKQEIHGRAHKDASNGINGIMSLNVESAKEHQYSKGEERVEQPTVATLPCQPHRHHSDTHMTTGESSRRTLTGIVGKLKNMVEEAIGIAGDRQRELRIQHIELQLAKIVLQVRKNTCGDILNADCLEIELRACHRQKNEDDIKEEEGGQYDKGGPLKAIVTPDKIEQGYLSRIHI